MQTVIILKYFSLQKALGTILDLEKILSLINKKIHDFLWFLFLFEKHDFCSYIIHYLLQKDQKWTKNVILPCRFSQIDILLGKTFFPRNSHGKFFRFPHFPFPMGKKFGWEIGTTSSEISAAPAPICIAFHHEMSVVDQGLLLACISKATFKNVLYSVNRKEHWRHLVWFTICFLYCFCTIYWLLLLFCV